MQFYESNINDMLKQKRLHLKSKAFALVIQRKAKMFTAWIAACTSSPPSPVDTATQSVQSDVNVCVCMRELTVRSIHQICPCGSFAYFFLICTRETRMTMQQPNTTTINKGTSSRKAAAAAALASVSAMAAYTASEQQTRKCLLFACYKQSITINNTRAHLHTTRGLFSCLAKRLSLKSKREQTSQHKTQNTTHLFTSLSERHTRSLSTLSFGFDFAHSGFLCDLGLAQRQRILSSKLSQFLHGLQNE